MAHIRTQIRAAAVAACAGLATTGANVIAGRVYPSEPPALSVYTPSDELDTESLAMGDARAGVHQVQIDMVGQVAAVDGADDLLDAIELEVIEAMQADPTLGGVLLDHWHTRSLLELEGEGERPVGQITITFTGYYRIAAADPGTGIE